MKKHRRIQALLSLILAFACLSAASLCGARAAAERSGAEKTYRNMKENLMWS
ncbi:MAG: hypothetical protein V8T10_02285 [Merdibacter sp.]